MTIKDVIPGSIADEIGIIPGDKIIAVNGTKTNDILDFWYGTESDRFTLEIKTGEELWEADIEKNGDEDLGIIFENDIDKIKSCRNNCIFCFVNQLPKGLRRSLYIKDDDYRLSFLSGSYITLTNLNDNDIARIIKQRLSPLYVSVHTVDDDLRRQMIGCNYSGSILNRLDLLVKSGIKINTQIVLCPRINDKEKLVQSIEELFKLYPGVQSLAVVPVGLTSHREECPRLAPADEKSSRETLDIIDEFQKKFLKKTGTRFVWGSDELYIKANREIPDAEFYEDFIQLENGVGMVAKFIGEVKSALNNIQSIKSANKRIAVATGVDFYPYMKKIADLTAAAFKCHITVYPVINIVFGLNVTVTGLLTGYDYLNSLWGRLNEDVLLLSEDCFKDGNDLLLDGMTLEKLSDELNIECRKVKDNGYDFINTIRDII